MCVSVLRVMPGEQIREVCLTNNSAICTASCVPQWCPCAENAGLCSHEWFQPGWADLITIVPPLIAAHLGLMAEALSRGLATSEVG